MPEQLSRLIGRFGDLHVLVIGEAMLDSYLEGTSGRLCPEAPVPVVCMATRRDAPGGAANTAVNARSLGAQVSFLSVTGDDADGAALRRSLESRGVAVDALLTQKGRRTLTKTRVIAGGQILVRCDQGDTTAVAAEAEQGLINRLIALFPRCDGVMISDYGCGILTPRVIAALAALQARSPRVMVGDSKRLADYRRVGLTAVKPNHDEALQLLGVQAPESSGSRVEDVSRRGSVILERTGARVAAVTLDTDGALIFERGRPPYRTYAQPNPQSRAAGAGDTFVSALTLALATGADTPAAADIAAAAAAVVVSKDGTATCSAAELQAFLEQRWQDQARAPASEQKPAADLAALAARLAVYRRQGRRIVFTNGCFDILHRGHVTYLSRARALGDVLVVGVNSDEGIRRLKGPGRPMNSLEDRLQVLAALSCVDHLIAFDEDTPHALIRVVRPDVFVKGGDYTRDRLPEAALVEELGGVVRILPLVESRSTTGLIERIRGSMAWVDGKAEGSGLAANGMGRVAAWAGSDGEAHGHTT